MEGNGRPPCYVINEDCRKDPGCPSFHPGVPCWSTKDVSCCRRNDKSRCIYCSVYLNFLYWKETGELPRTKQEAFRDEGFKRISKARYEIISSGQYNEINCRSLAGGG